MNEKVVGQIADVVKEIAKPLYDDVRPVVKPAAGLLSLPVRAVKTMLLPFEKWVVSREQSLDDFINRRVPEQLQGVPEDKIKPPNAYFAVPILQAASYCDSDELKDLYASLLAKSMYDDTKERIHPSFAKIIEEISPDEAKILRHLNDKHTGGTSTIFSAKLKLRKHIYVPNFSDLAFNAGCEQISNTPMYIENLLRLGLIAVQHSPKRDSIISRADLIKYFGEDALKALIEDKLHLLVAVEIKKNNFIWNEVNDIMNDEGLIYECRYKEQIRTTEYYIRFASVVIEPIIKSEG